MKKKLKGTKKRPEKEKQKQKKKPLLNKIVFILQFVFSYFRLISLLSNLTDVFHIHW